MGYNYGHETPEQAGYEVYTLSKDAPHKELVLIDKETKKKELFAECPNYAGWAIQYANTQFEFVRELK
mgnify:CR=1 FL=1